MTGLKKLAAGINNILTKFTVLLLIILCIVTVLQVGSRYIFNSPLSWTEEILRYLLVWITFLGFGLVVYKKTEMSVSFLTSLLNNRIRLIVEEIVILLILPFLIVLIWEGFKFAFDSWEIATIALRIPFTWINISAPLGGVFLFVLYLLRFIETIGHLKDPSFYESDMNGCPSGENSL